MKDLLKEIKLNESTISMMFGALLVLIVGTLLISNFRNQDNLLNRDNASDQGSQTENDVDLNRNGTYTVAEGDSLWTIAEREYGTGYEWTEIAAANPGIQSSGDIEIGQEIIIPDTNKILEEAASTSAEGVQESAPIAQVTPVPVEATPAAQHDHNEVQLNTQNNADRSYTVKTGDNLWNIAVEMYGDGYRWTDIAKANSLSNPDVIHNGNTLTIPA